MVRGNSRCVIGYQSRVIIMRVACLPREPLLTSVQPSAMYILASTYLQYRNTPVNDSLPKLCRECREYEQAAHSTRVRKIYKKSLQKRNSKTHTQTQSKRHGFLYFRSKAAQAERARAETHSSIFNIRDSDKTAQRPVSITECRIERRSIVEQSPRL